MRRAAMDTDRRRARDARLALGVLLALSVAANLVLGYGLSLRERVTVLVPAVSGPAWEVGESWAGRRYLEDAARTATVTLLTLTPENAPHVREAAARLAAPEARGAIGAWVAAEAERMARRDLTTAFYPRRIESATEELSVEIGGGGVRGDRAGRSASGEPARARAARRGQGPASGGAVPARVLAAEPQPVRQGRVRLLAAAAGRDGALGAGDHRGPVPGDPGVDGAERAAGRIRVETPRVGGDDAVLLARAAPALVVRPG